MGGEMKSAEKLITTRLNPRWCSPDDIDKDHKLMEVLRPAVLGCPDSLGVHWLGAWPTSRRHCCPACQQIDSSWPAATSIASPSSWMCWVRTTQSSADMDCLDCSVGACSRERAVQADNAGVSPRCSVALPSWSAFDLILQGQGVASLEGWSAGCAGRVHPDPAVGERPPRALGLDLSLPSGTMRVPGAVRGRILPPWDRLGCHHVRY